jgi:hypothetical protein
MKNVLCVERTSRGVRENYVSLMNSMPYKDMSFSNLDVIPELFYHEYKETIIISEGCDERYASEK